MRILPVGAHPDDLEILCGGTLARYVQEGHEVLMCHATRGDRGSFVHTSAEIAQIRGEEAARAAEIAGAEYVSLGLHDSEVNSKDPEQRRIVVDLVRDSRPDVIITRASPAVGAGHAAWLRALASHAAGHRSRSGSVI